MCNHPGAVGPFTRVTDAFTAKAYLANQPIVDGKRIAVLGMSHGGWTTLWAVQNSNMDAAPGATRSERRWQYIPGASRNSPGSTHRFSS